MNELFLYDRDNGLFKKILALSSVMQGRYFVLPEGGPEINTSSFGQYLNDALSGLQTPQKYPCALLMPPRSYVASNQEVFSFTMLFLTRAGHTGQNQLKQPNVAAQVSTHHAWFDWQDMSDAAKQFTLMLQDVIRNRSISENQPLRSLVHLINDPYEIKRISNVGNDKTSGVVMNFRMEIKRNCSTSEYSDTAVSDIILPTLTIHPPHKH